MQERNDKIQTEIENLIINTKVCTRCGVEKPVSSFYEHKDAGLQSYCKSCSYDYNKQYYHKNKDKYAEYRKQYKKQFDGKYIYTIHNINGEIVYIGSTVNLYKRSYNHITGYSNISDYMVKNEWLAIKYIKLDDGIDENELRYIEQCFIDTFNPILNKKNACVEFDFIEGNRLAYIMGLADSLIDNYDKISDIWKVNKNIA